MDKVRTILLAILCGFVLGSCQKAAKKVLKEVAEEETETLAGKGAKKLAKELGEELGEELTEKDAKKLLKKLALEDAHFAKRWDDLPDVYQRSVLKSIERQPSLIALVKSDSRLFDDYLAKGSKNAIKQPDLFAYFAKSAQRSQSNYGFSHINALDFVDEGDAVKFVTKGTNPTVLGELKDGLLSIKLPDRGEDLFRHSLLKDQLIPNTSYKIRTVEGKLKYTIRTDNLGRITQIEGTGLRAHQLNQNILQMKEGIDMQLGRKVDPGQDLNVKAVYSYDGASDIPSSAKLSVTGGNGFSYKDVVLNKGTIRDLSKVDITGLLKKHGLPDDKVAKCIEACEKDPNLKELIVRDPRNIQRWLNTRNKVDKSLVARTANGALVANYSYSGNRFYFHPALNPNLASKLKSGQGFVNLKKTNAKLSVDELIELDRMFPNGIPFTKAGYPDFSSVAYTRGGKPVIFDLTKFTNGAVDRNADINKAKKLFATQYGYASPEGYTWHHIENSRKIMLVRTDVHALIAHAGGVSTSKAAH